jgi:hypothetical protein
LVEAGDRERFKRWLSRFPREKREVIRDHLRMTYESRPRSDA